MYIFSQDTECIISFDSFSQVSICKMLPGSKERRFSLAVSNGTAGPWTLGYYATEKEAKTELERLAAAIREGEKIFDVK